MSTWATSSSVDRKASTSWCGRRRTNPTVSLSSATSPPGSCRRRVERREQAVLDERIGARQPVQQGRLAGVRVADERDRRKLAAPAGLALGGPGLGETLQLALELVHPTLDATTVDFELGLTR